MPRGPKKFDDATTPFCSHLPDIVEVHRVLEAFLIAFPSFSMGSTAPDLEEHLALTARQKLDDLCA